ncbi:hypothetical protein [Psychrobacter immobilis]|uniref:hypothetical protein n=1 Tax=Psychrobacter immobilis TaxID=498 RepID=UPI001918B767|nr:hypothetical protein [Psychrobacter immobilis]
MNSFDNSLTIKAIGAFIALSTLSYTAYAKPPIKEKYEVLSQATKYAESVACSTTFSKDNGKYRTTIKDIYLIEDTEDYDNKGKLGFEYIILWGGDVGCNGGSGTYSYYLTSFSRHSENRPFLVNQMNILDDVNSETYQINDRFIEDVKYDNGVFVITASDYSNEGDDAGNNFPANRYKYKLTHDNSPDNYKWKLVDKNFIGKTKSAIKK